MNKMDLKKKVGVVALAIVFMAVIIVIPNIAFATSSTLVEEDTQLQVTAYAKGIAIQKINNETVEMPANLTLTAEPVEDREKLILFKIVGGKVDVDGTVYTISEGRGVVVKPRQIIMLHCKGTSSDGAEVTLSLHARYFWMGGHLYGARVKGILKIGEDTRMLLLLRGYARIP